MIDALFKNYPTDIAQHVIDAMTPTIQAEIKRVHDAVEAAKADALKQALAKFNTNAAANDQPSSDPNPPVPPMPGKRRSFWDGKTAVERKAIMSDRWVVRKANKELSGAVNFGHTSTLVNALANDEKIAAHRKAEVYRTPRSAFTPLMDYRPEWFEGIGFDPSAGDGRMISEVIVRGNPGPHHLVEIRAEEWPKLARLGEVTIADYLAIREPAQADFLITNPPFSLTDAFIEKARSHISGPMMILQQSAWCQSKARSKRLKGAGLSHILHLRDRPRWEMDHGAEPPGRFYGFAWFVFQPGYTGDVVTDWLDEPQKAAAIAVGAQFRASKS